MEEIGDKILEKPKKRLKNTKMVEEKYIVI